MGNTSTILKTILTIVFLLLAAMKIFGFKPMTKMFKDFRLNRLAMILVGMIEILCVVALSMSNLAFYACIGFAYLSSAALYRQIKANHPFIKFIPTVVLLILSLFTAAVLFKPN